MTKEALKLIAEYRPSMGIDVLHLWAKDAIAALREALAQPQQEPPFSVQQAYAMAQVCLDLHEALGCKWGDNPYLVIACLLEAQPAQPQEQNGCPVCGSDVHDRDALDKAEREIERLSALVAQPQQEQVAVHQFRSMYSAAWQDGHPDPKDGYGPYKTRTLYTTPPQRTWVGSGDLEDSNAYLTQPAQRTWVGLTDAERKEVFRSCESKTPTAFLIAIEQALKEKNT